MATSIALTNISGVFCSKIYWATRLSHCTRSRFTLGNIKSEPPLQQTTFMQVCRLWAGSTFSSSSQQQLSSKEKKPKHPANVFIMYLQTVQQQLQKENPDASRREIVSLASQKWKMVDPEEKSKLTMQRRELFQKYKEDLKYYINNMTPEDMRLEERKKQQKMAKRLKVARRELGMPKMPASAFSCFMAEQYPLYAGEDSVTRLFKKLRERWSSLDEKDREVYKKQSAKRSEIYKEEMERWEKEMMELGRFDVIRKSTLLRLAMDNNPKRNAKKDSVEL